MILRSAYPQAVMKRMNRGFTLVEILLSLSLVAVILGCAYACLSAGFAAKRVIDPRADALRQATYRSIGVDPARP